MANDLNKHDLGGKNENWFEVEIKSIAEKFILKRSQFFPLFVENEENIAVSNFRNLTFQVL